MKKKFFNVLPECYVDTNLIEYLLDGNVNHQHSCSKVVGTLKNKFIDQFAIGIIDRDKVKVGYIKECDEVASIQHLSLFKHKTQPQYLITIEPAVDGFILDCSLDQKVNPEDYGLPSKLEDFTKISKSVTSNIDTRFKYLFKALINNRELRNLKLSLEYMVRNTYKIEMKVLLSLFTAP